VGGEIAKGIALRASREDIRGEGGGRGVKLNVSVK